MSNGPTSGNTIFFRFVMLCVPVGIFFALLLSCGGDAGVAAAGIFIPVFLGAVAFVFWFARAVVNTGFKAIDPQGYKEFQQRGIDPFFASQGAPLNFDSDLTRIGVWTASCPKCGGNIQYQPNVNACCPTCNSVMWHENRWWAWDSYEEKWFYIPTTEELKASQHQEPQQECRQASVEQDADDEFLEEWFSSDPVSRLRLTSRKPRK